MAPIVDELAVGAARRHHRDLALEIDEGFEHGFLLADSGPGFGDVLRRIDFELALAVVAEGRGFEDRGISEIAQRLLEIVERAHFAIGRDGQAGFGREMSFRGCAAGWCGEWPRPGERARSGQRLRL